MDRILVHNCVFTGNLGVPVSRNNSVVQKSIEEELQCRAEILVCVCDENMFAISCLLKSFKTPLVEVGWSTGRCPRQAREWAPCRQLSA